MNADAYLLLNTALRDQPCFDPLLIPAVQTAPFAVHSIAQQCYYFLYLYSCAKAQLADTTSAYNTAVQFSAVQQRIKLEEQLGQTVSEAPARLTWPLSLPPAAPTGNLELRLTIIGGGTVARCLLRRLLRDTSNEVSSAASSPPVPGSTDLLFHPSRVTVLTRQPQTLAEFAMKGVRCLGTSHGKAAVNASDLVVLACQPQHLPDVARELFTATRAAPPPVKRDAAAATRGESGALWAVADPSPPPREDTTAVVVLGVEKPARLKNTAVVVSTLAAVPVAKIAAALGHDARLILRPRVAAPAALPVVAARHEAAAEECATLQVRHFADHDSFLREAVVEAEGMTIARLAAEMAACPDGTMSGGAATTAAAAATATGGGSQKGAKVPIELAMRAAMRAATLATAVERFLPPQRSTVLLAEAPPMGAFVTAAWATLQQVVKALMLAMAAAEERRGDRPAAAGGRSATAKAGKAAAAAGQKYRRQKPGAQKAHAGPADDEDGAAEAPLVQLCAALAMLPESGRTCVTFGTLHRYGVLPPGAMSTLAPSPVSSPPASGDGKGPEAEVGNDGSHRHSSGPAAAALAGHSAAVPREYRSDREGFQHDVLQQFRYILSNT